MVYVVGYHKENLKMDLGMIEKSYSNSLLEGHLEVITKK